MRRACRINAEPDRSGDAGARAGGETAFNGQLIYELDDGLWSVRIAVNRS